MQEVRCPVCQGRVSLESKQTKKGRPCLMIVCLKSGSHYRAFINDQPFIKHMIGRIEAGAG